MKRKHLLIKPVLAFLLCLAAGSMGASAAAEAADGVSQVTGNMQPILSKLNLAGGISGGWFHASNPGPYFSGSEFLLSNLLVELSYEEEDLPIGFVAAFGQTSTPSVLDPPINNKDLAIEYAGIMLNPVDDLILEVGLLGPNSGYEDTYTFVNRNILLGAVASQQPYNAYGAKFGYETGGFFFWGGYYRDRLVELEYAGPEDSWEIGVEGELAGNNVGFYHYHVGGFRYLTGVAVERTIEGMDVGLNIDYWAWADRMKDSFGSNRSIGGAVYVSQRFGDVSIPLRLEYIYQGESEIYIESPAADNIFTAVITPTYHFSETAYARAEASWVVADDGFEDENGGSKDSNIGLAVEFGLIF